MAVSFLLSALLATACVASPAAADTAASTLKTPPAEVSIPNTRRVDFVSHINGHRYSIRVALPFEPTPARGYGVLYVLDGYDHFASATEAVRSYGDAAAGVVVVGIGYPDDVAPQLERFHDLTLPASDRALAAQTVLGAPPLESRNVGGLDDFLKVIETEIKPLVASLAPIDQRRQALFGHSLGGLAVLHALFVEPNAFHTFIIASPSIWWNDKAVLADEAAFAATVRAGRAAPRVLVTMGSEESTKARMVDNAAQLVSRLQALKGHAGYFVEDYVVFDRQVHALSAWSALARAIPFAFSDSR